jgi:hypothetical protein
MQEKPDEARPYFKDRIALAMNLLEDDDISNDIQAWEILAFTLLQSGDLVNGAAALAITHAPRYDVYTVGSYTNEMPSAPVEDNWSIVPPINGEEKPAIDNEIKEAENPPEYGNLSLVADQVDASTLEVSNTIQGEVKVAEDNSQNNQPQTDSKDRNEFAPADGQAETQGGEDFKPTFQDLWAPQPYQAGLCDGPCMREFDFTDLGVYYCTYCYDTQICVSCFELFQKGMWLYKKCDLSHQHAFVNGPPLGLRVKDADKVKVGQVVMSRKVWLDEIRANWGLDVARKEEG